MEGIVKVACVQAEPVPFDKAATIEKIEGLAAEVAGEGARLALFPETFIPAYPSNRWVRYLAGGGSPEKGDGRATFARPDRPVGTADGLVAEGVGVDAGAED